MKDGIPEKDIQKLPTYKLPFYEKDVSHETLFDVHGEDPLFLRPADVDRLYCIPISTIYDWISHQPETHFPAFKIVTKLENKRRMVLIPKKLLDEWLIEHGTLARNK